jgi:hypothetical protein
MISRHARSWRSGRVIAAAMLMAAALACHAPWGGSSPEPALIHFTNESLDQAAVYVVVPGVEARRIGTVMSGRTDTLMVPTDLVSRGTVNIVARMLARSISVATGLVTLYPGEEYQVKLSFDQKLLSFLPAP